MAIDAVDLSSLHHLAIEKGDRVVITSRKVDFYVIDNSGAVHLFENHEIAWGLVATVIAFSMDYLGRFRGVIYEQRKPGFYKHPTFFGLTFKDAEPASPLRRFRNALLYFVHSDEFMLFNQSEYRKRIAKLHKAREHNPYPEDPPVLLHEAIDGVLWEGDQVRADDVPGVCTIQNLRYALPITNRKKEAESVPFVIKPHDDPYYIINSSVHLNGKEFRRTREQLTLVSRGHFWNQAHGIPLVFENLADEAFFAVESRAIDLVSFNNQRSWYVEDEARSVVLQECVGDGIRFDDFEDLDPSWWNVISFHDRDLGARVKKATAEGFIIPSPMWKPNSQE